MTEINEGLPLKLEKQMVRPSRRGAGIVTCYIERVNDLSARQ